MSILEAEALDEAFLDYMVENDIRLPVAMSPEFASAVERIQRALACGPDAEANASAQAQEIQADQAEL
jgi:hypothetical protein